MSVSVTLDAREISGIHRNGSSGQASVQDYLESRMRTYEAGGEQCLFLPSLVSLSECFQCPAVEVHEALNTLKERGCDFYVMGFESPITLWYPARI